MMHWFYSKTDLTTTNAVSRPLSAPVVSSSTIADNSSDRSKESSIISTDVTLSLKKNRSGEDKGISFVVKTKFHICFHLNRWDNTTKCVHLNWQRTKRRMTAAVVRQHKLSFSEEDDQRDVQPACAMLAPR